ncbi:MAG TPA: molybdopterin cofactor-binding domain-containing protein [Kofleriaceae bacterium]|nr:molybdopterin cofactor-binding domain-containing protein [Kofleriaceae bacterium]
MSAPVLVTRRSFLVGLNLAAGGLALGILPRGARGDEPSGFAGPGPKAASQEHELATAGLSPNVLVHIAPDGVTTIVCHRSEMGQGVRSSLPVLIAAELGARLDRVVVVQAVGDKKYGDQNTDGSSSVRKFFDDLRRAGAAARHMLIAAAAKRWKVRPATCVAEDHQVVHRASKRALGFGELVAAAAKLPVPKPKELTLRPMVELRKVLHPSLPLLDGPAIVDGSARFGADVSVPGMLVAVIARPPVVGGTVKDYDADAAMKVPGVKKVVEMPAPKAPWMFQPWGGVAVVAENTWAAMKGRAALRITWDDGVNGAYDSTTFRDELLASVRAAGTTRRELGDVDAAMKAAARVIEAEYVVPHLAHMPMEPPTALARVTGDTVEIWAPTQHPQAARAEVARVLGVPEAKVTVHVTLLGGGFGRKSKADFASEAAFLARAAGAPVRVQWTRDDDIRHCYYNAVNAQRLRAAIDEGGVVSAWHHRTAFTPIGNTFDPATDEPSGEDLQQGVLDLALAVPNVRAESCKAKPQVRIGWYRSVYNIFHAFAIGSFIDELAAARKVDPRTMWLDLIGPARTLSLKDLGIAKLANYGHTLDEHPVDAGRLRGVIERVTAAAKWDDRKGRHLGLAAHRSFVSYAAVVISVIPDKLRAFRIDDAWICLDAGTVVNEERVRAQLEGGLIMGISNALFGGITMKRGRTVESNYRDARIARIQHAPRRIHTDIVPSDELPCGVGEPPVPPVGPALANALFALTGKRIREIPLAASLDIREGLVPRPIAGPSVTRVSTPTR